MTNAGFLPISSNVFSNSVSLTTIEAAPASKGHGSSAAVEGSVCLSVLHCRSVRLRSQNHSDRLNLQQSLACHHQLEPVSRSLLLTPRSFFILCTDKAGFVFFPFLGIGKIHLIVDFQIRNLPVFDQAYHIFFKLCHTSCSIHDHKRDICLGQDFFCFLDSLFPNSPSSSVPGYRS